jgi:hypothetical protein
MLEAPLNLRDTEEVEAGEGGDGEREEVGAGLTSILPHNLAIHPIASKGLTVRLEIVRVIGKQEYFSLEIVVNFK